ncbi:hypothetical protein JTE90_023670 [Oedothorax gibbosus]|uniref:Uncharacterized protein n=1 Tax=Oedothorax gibbosus TaxID=931172 RepID=A0AAV6U867_9ARAC|nr:hypothetical protein JTE90_023670 [Oedothorax gibbosus]
MVDRNFGWSRQRGLNKVKFLDVSAKPKAVHTPSSHQQHCRGGGISSGRSTRSFTEWWTETLVGHDNMNMV